LLEGRGYDYSYDWWCLGILAYELLVGIPPFFARRKQDMYDKIKKEQGRVPFPPKKHPASISKEA
jgi:serine/threonine protein kinase